MRRLILAVLAVVSMVATPAVAQTPPVLIAHPVEGIEPRIPDVTAAGWVLWDDTYGIVLASFEADVQRPMASTTKMMTALVAMDSGRTGQMVEVSERAAAIGEAEVDLVPGEILPFNLLVETMLVRSANDAAMAVAEASAGTVEDFVTRMNSKAEEMGLENTSFANPHGLDRTDHYSTPNDLLAMGKAVMENPILAAYVGQAEVEFPPDPKNGKTRPARTTNELLSEYPGVLGVKTGYTNRAGQCLVVMAQRGERRLYAVVMGSTGIKGHFRDAEVLLDFGFDEFGIFDIIDSGQGLVSIRTAGGEVPVVSNERVPAFVHIDTRADDLIEFRVVGDEPSITVVGRETALQPFTEPNLPGFGSALGWWPKIVDWFQ